MILSPDETLCFLHIPKTAGLTLRMILDLQFSRSQICPAEDYSTLAPFSRADLGRYRLLRGHFWYNVKERLPSQPVLITVLRDPIERSLSQYEYVRTQPSGTPLHDLVKNMSLDEYLHDEYVRECTVRDVQTRYLAPANQPLDVYEVASLEHRGLEQAKANLTTCAFVGIVERFDDMLKLLAYTFGWRPAREVAARNRSEKRVQRSELSGPVLDYLHELNENDLKLYGCAKAIFEERFAAMTDEILRDRYDRRRRAGMRPRTSIRVNFDDPIDGDGWYPPEVNSDGQVFRWTGPGLTASIDLPLLPGTERLLKIKVMDWADPGLAESLTVSVNRESMTMSADPQDPALLTGLIPPHVLPDDRGMTTIALTVPRTFNPLIASGGENQDDRQLGIPIAWIEAEATDVQKPTPSLPVPSRLDGI